MVSSPDRISEFEHATHVGLEFVFRRPHLNMNSNLYAAHFYLMSSFICAPLCCSLLLDTWYLWAQAVVLSCVDCLVGIFVNVQATRGEVLHVPESCDLRVNMMFVVYVTSRAAVH